MTLGSIQPLAEMSTRNLPAGKGRPARKADLTAIYESVVYKMWEPRLLTTVWAFMACYRGGFNFFSYEDAYVILSLILWEICRSVISSEIMLPVCLHL
jgi:hypothetical protein